MTYAFGGAPNYSGLSMRKAHERLVREKGLNGDHFNAIAENLTVTLQELNVPPELISEVIAIVGSARNDVLSSSRCGAIRAEMAPLIGPRTLRNPGREATA